MSALLREWSDAFFRNAATTEMRERTVGKITSGARTEDVVARLQIKWLSLPRGTARGGPVKMTPAHGNVYMAFLLHLEGQDLTEESVQSTASVAQIAKTCFWSLSQVEEMIHDLVAVGFLHRAKRFKRSSVTTIFREPGNFSAPASTPTAEADEPSQTVASNKQARPRTTNALPTAAALHEAMRPYYAVDGTSDSVWATQIAQALAYPTAEAVEVVDLEGDRQVILSRLQFLLPTDYVCTTTTPQNCVCGIFPSVRTALERVLTAITGKPARIGKLDIGVQARTDVPLILWYRLFSAAGRDERLHSTIANATNPTGYLLKALPDLIARWDAAMAAQVHEAEETDTTEPDDQDDYSDNLYQDNEDYYSGDRDPDAAVNRHMDAMEPRY